MKALKWLLAIVVVAAVAIGGKRVLDGRQQEQPGPVVEPPRTRVTALGRLEPAGRLVAIGGPVGTRLAAMRAREGQTVGEGDVLALLQGHAARQADLARARLEQSRVAQQTENKVAALRQKVADYEALLAAERALGQAQIGLRQAELRQLEQTWPQVEKVGAAQVAEARVQLDLATQEQERLKTASARGGAVTQKQLDEAAQQVLLRARQQERIQATVARVAAEHEQQTAVARQRLASARALLGRATSTVALDLSQARADLALAEATREADVEQARQAVLAAEAALSHTILRAPRDGQVLAVHTRAGEAITGPVLELGDTRRIIAVAEVYETDIGLVRQGLRAVVSSPALPRDVAGEVVEIRRLVAKQRIIGLDPSADVDARVVEVRIALEPDEAAAALIQLQVDVTIELGSER